jgi:4-amino-4-deoxy-L-arabinose transferase-like glycosyltransferase
VFGGPTGAFRLFSSSLGGQGAWLLGFALFGGLGIALTVRRRRDPRLAALIVLGGWFLTEAVVLSFANGIVHPYYVSAMAPGLAAMVGAGAVALAGLARGGGWRMLPALAALTAGVAAEIVLLHQERYLEWLVPILVVGAGAGAALLLARRRLARPAMAAIVALLLIAPTAFSSTTWSSPVNGTFPAAGNQAAGPGGAPRFGGAAHLGGMDRVSASSGLVRFLRTHRSGTRFQLLAQSSMTAGPLIIDGIKVGAMGGFNGDDPALSASGLARLVASGEARYVEVGGAFPGRGANSATSAVSKVCRKVPSSQWQTGSTQPGAGSPGAGGPFGSETLYDCGGLATQLAGAARGS